jgi:hypothetical protein
MTTTQRYRVRNGAAAQPRTYHTAKILLTFAAVVAVVSTYYFARAQRMTEMTAALYRTVELRRDMDAATKANEQLRCKLAELQRPEYILGMLRQRGVHLSVAPLERTIYVKLPPRTDAAAPPAARPATTPAAPGTLLVSTRSRESQ